MPKRPMLFAVSVLAATLLYGGPAAAQTPPPDALAAAKELIVTMRAADQLKNLFPVIMQQLKPAIVQGRPQVEKDYDAIMPALVDGMLARSGELVDLMADVYARNFTAGEIRQSSHSIADRWVRNFWRRCRQSPRKAWRQASSGARRLPAKCAAASSRNCASADTISEGAVKPGRDGLRHLLLQQMPQLYLIA